MEKNTVPNPAKYTEKGKFLYKKTAENICYYFYSV